MSGITSDADLLTYLRGANTPGSVLLLQYNSAYAKQNAAGIYTQVGDMWSLISVGPHGSLGNSANGVKMSAGTSSGGQTVVYDIWTDKNLVKQTGAFDTTAGSVMLNGAWGWGGNGQAFNYDETTTIAWLGSSGSRISRNKMGSNQYTKKYSSSLLIRAGDTWAAMSIGYAPNGDSSGIVVSSRNISGTTNAMQQLWTNLNLVKQLSKVDSTAGSLLINEAFGLGADGPVYNVSDFNTASRNGFIAYGSNRGGAPSSQPRFGMLMGFDSNSRGQLISEAGSDELRYRATAGGTWKGWTRLINDVSAQTITGSKVFSRACEALIIKPPTASNPSFIRGQFANGSSHCYVGKPDANSNNVNISNQYSGAASTISLDEAGHIKFFVLAGKSIYARVASVDRPILASGLNAVADSNGFWKTASPVVKLFSDGTSKLTSEAEGITTVRLSEGVYRISGCLGLNADRAWGGDDGEIDVPMCRNKLPRLWVDYGGDEGSEQINPDGSIVIRTYHRPHPDAPAFARNEIEGYANGDPIDIPHDTFISVRVQMPEVEVQQEVVEKAPNQAENDVVLETST